MLPFTKHVNGRRGSAGHAPSGTQGVRTLLQELGCVSQQEQSLRRGAAQLGRHEWWLTDLARALGMPRVTLFGWIKRGWVTAHQLTDQRGSWIIHANPAEVERLRRLNQQSRVHRPRKPGSTTNRPR
ncbi:hypothetical protein ACFYZ2_01635 [Streptomyces sviceus]|uniref:hypothetical protein n=1 Tax=Streptomyces sviceus TaxID=285530 RepID=UPI0036862B30